MSKVQEARNAIHRAETDLANAKSLLDEAIREDKKPKHSPKMTDIFKCFKFYKPTVLQDDPGYPIYSVVLHNVGDNTGSLGMFADLAADHDLHVGNVGIKDGDVIVHFFESSSFK